MTITINRDYRERGRAPLYQQYDGQTGPQPAYLELTEDGRVRVDWSGEIGNAVPIRVYDGRDTRWTVPASLSVAGIDALIDEIAPMLERYHEATGQDRMDLQIDIERRIEETCEYPDTPLHEQVGDACDWASPEWESTVEDYEQAEDRDAFIQGLRDIATADRIVLVNIGRLRGALDEALESRMESLSDIAEELERPERTVQWHAKRLGIESRGGYVSGRDAKRIRESIDQAKPGRPPKPPTE